jgi:hypothetical protein
VEPLAHLELPQTRMRMVGVGVTARAARGLIILAFRVRKRFEQRI